MWKHSYFHIKLINVSLVNFSSVQATAKPLTKAVLDEYVAASFCEVALEIVVLQDLHQGVPQTRDLQTQLNLLDYFDWVHMCANVIQQA